MLAFSVYISRQGEKRRSSLLFGVDYDCVVDRMLRDACDKVLEFKGGYPNKYAIRNSQLPVTALRKCNNKGESVRFDMGPIPGVPDDELLIAEVWDES